MHSRTPAPRARMHQNLQVDAVPLPCSSLAAIAAEVNDPSQAGCQRNAGNSVSHALAAGGRTHFLQLVLATGLLPAIDKTAGAFTIFAPSDAAVEAAGAAGTFDYGNLFATNKDLLRQIVGYHIASGQALLQPSQGSASSLAPTLMKGDPGCGAGGAPSWRADGLVRGGRGVARAGAPVEGERRGGGGEAARGWGSRVQRWTARDLAGASSPLLTSGARRRAAAALLHT